MPHLVIQYTADIEARAKMTELRRTLAGVLVAQQDADGRQVFPIGGIRVLAYPAAYCAVADGSSDHAFDAKHSNLHPLCNR